MLGGEIYYRAIGRPWGPAADFIHVVNVKFHLSAPGRLVSSIRGPPARAIPKFVCPTVRLSLSVWPRAGLRGPVPAAAGLHYPRHRDSRVPLTRSLHTRSESSGPGATGRPAALAAREVAAFKFESGRDSERVLRRSTIMIRRPPTRAVRLSDRPTVCHESAPGSRPARPCAPCARAIRVGIRFGPGKKKHQGLVLLTIDTPFGTSP